MDNKEILEYLDKRGVATAGDLRKKFGINDEQAHGIMKQLVKDREAFSVKKGDAVCSLRAKGRVKGVLSIKQGGFGFVLSEDGDVFVGKKDIKAAFDGDVVLVKLKVDSHDGRRREGKIEEILSDGPQTVVGVVRRRKNGLFVVADSRSIGNIYIKKSGRNGAEDGQVVLTEITRRGDGEEPHEGVIREILGVKGEPGVDILAIAKTFGLEEPFHSKVVREAERVSRIPVEEKELARRETLFSKTIFTIDGDDAKDLDDAVSLERLKNGNLLLGVHIADVSWYVAHGSELDKEALERGTSVYLLDRVIPMLPKQLSNGICSLNERELRLTMSCFMEVSPHGKVLSHRLAETAIISRHRMTYHNVNAILEGDGALRAKYRDIEEPIADMAKLAAAMRKIRMKQGSIDFDLDEARISLDASGKPTDVSLRERGAAERMIEEFMIAANNSVAEEFFYKEIPFLYRIHEAPDPDKMRELSIFLSNFGYRLHGAITNKMLQEVLIDCEGRREEAIINKVSLRSLKKAKYSTENKGHFGLASSAYSHFTSPIRRYPDLQIHRIIREYLRGELDEKRKSHYARILPEVAAKSSDREKRAIEAERMVDDIKKAEYISRYIGETFDGVVSGVTGSALFVELPNTVEGVVPLKTMRGDYYEYNREMYCVIGERTREKISLGDSAKICVERVDVDTARVEFSLIQEKGNKKKRPHKGGKKKREKRGKRR